VCWGTRRPYNPGVSREKMAPDNRLGACLRYQRLRLSMTIRPCARHWKCSCNLWATALPLLARLRNFSTPGKLITDVQMPGLSGFDLHDRLIALGHRIPIIFITAHPDENVRMRAMTAGAVGIMSKPFTHDHLLGYLAKASKAT
jgi:FixJ family two-component response regulator